MRSVRLQMRRKEFERHTLAVGLSVTLADLKKAEQEEGPREAIIM